jgi:hypothetical protein
MYRSAILKASEIGTHTTKLVKEYWLAQLEFTYNSICDFLELKDEFTPQQIEAAARRAAFYKILSLKIVTTVLSQKLESLSLDESTNIFGD